MAENPNRSSSPGLSSDEIVEKVNTQLPIHVTKDKIESNPEFSRLVLDLTDRFTPNGITKERSFELEKAKVKYSAERSLFLQEQLSYSCLEDVLEEFYLSSKELSYDHSTKTQVLKSLQTRKENVEIQDYLQFDTDDENTRFLGLTSEYLDSMTIPLKDENKIIDLIEENLQEKLKTITAYILDDETNSKVIHATSNQLPSFIENRQLQLKERVEALEKEKQKQLKLVEQLHDTIKQSMELLRKFITHYRLKIQSDSVKVQSQYYFMKSDALLLKIRLMELNILCKTYTPESVNALRKIRNSLNEKQNITEKELSTMTHTLQVYEAAGNDLKKIIEEYTEIKKNYENKKWALRELST